MRNLSILNILISFLSLSVLTTATPTGPQHAVSTPSRTNNISLALFADLEELARIVDISYCVGTTGISKPFQCASRCDEFEGFELVDTWSTGALMGDGCGYMVLDHGSEELSRQGRIIVAFRGTYSVADTIVDLSTVPQEYVPYPGGEGNETDSGSVKKGKKFWPWNASKAARRGAEGEKKEMPKCGNCTVHSGFLSAWKNTRPFVLPHIEYLKTKHPDYQLELVGHSLGGAVAALAGLEFEALEYEPRITTFGEPRVGNVGLRDYIDAIWEGTGRYRRVTHVDDPVPLLPLQEWGYRAHAGEVFISKPSLQPGIDDLRMCTGDEDVECSAGAEVGEKWFESSDRPEVDISKDEATVLKKRWGIPIPARYKMWQLFFAHRDYFWRLGLCVPGGDPLDWGRERYHFGEDAEADGDRVKVELR